MRVGDFCSHSVVTCRHATRVVELARIMRDQHVGAVVIVEPQAGARPRPVGVVTDRDLVVQVMAQTADPELLLVGDLLVADLVSARVSESVYKAARLMSVNGVRRLPVVDERGGLVGIVVADDLIRAMAEVMVDASRTAQQQVARERLTRP